MSNNEISCVAQWPGPRSMDRRGFLRRVVMGMGASALALAAVKPALADTIITRNHVSVNGDKLAKTATCVVGKSGAVDYCTEDYASDDLAIQAAIDYVEVDGGKIVIREGEYTIENNMALTSGCSLKGCGDSTLLVLGDGANCDMIDITGRYNAVSDMQLKGNKTNNTSGSGLVFNPGSYRVNRINSLTIQNFKQDGLQILGTVTDPTYSVFASDIAILSCDGYGVYQYSTYCSDWELSNFLILYCGTGMRLESSYNRLSHIDIYDSTNNGLEIRSDHNTLNNSVIEFSGKANVDIYKSGNAVGNIITSNSIRYGSQLTNDTYSDININTSTDTIVSNNTIAAAVSGNISKYNIALVSATDNLISNNAIIASGVTGTILNPGGNRIINNIGFNPTGNLTAPSVPATTVNYTNTYGYPCQVLISGGTVTEIDLADIPTGLTSGLFVIAPGETINITYSSVPTWKWWGL